MPALKRTETAITIASEDLNDYARTISVLKQQKSQYQISTYDRVKIMSDSPPTSLKMLSTVRQLTSLAKVKGTALLILSKLFNEGREVALPDKYADGSDRKPLVVFVWFKETARRLQEFLQDELQVKMFLDVVRTENGTRAGSTSEQTESSAESMEELKEVAGRKAIRCSLLTGDVIKQQVQPKLLDCLSFNLFNIL